MKKHFLYVAMVLAMMSSCSNDNDLIAEAENGNQNNPEMVPINLGIGMAIPEIDVQPGTRGTGIVGSTEDKTNQWDGQELGIIMVKQGTFAPAKIFNEGEKFYAPKATKDNIKSSGLVTFNSNQIYYYPLQGQFDFFGYHVDATDTKLVTEPAQPTEAEITSMKVTATIDGTNDVMAATADLTKEQKNATSGEGKLAPNDEWRAYGAWAARKGVQPTLTFKHMLSRLTFHVKAGQNSAATDNYVGTQLPDHYLPNNYDALKNLKVGDVVSLGKGDVQNPAEAVALKDGAVYVHSIKILNQKSNIELSFNKSEIATQSKEPKTKVTRKQPTLAFAGTDEGKATFTLMQKPAEDALEKKLVELNPVAPKEKLDDPDNGQQATPVGDGIIMAGDQETVKAEIILMQYVKIKNEIPNPEGEATPAEYEWKAAKMQFDIAAPEQGESEPKIKKFLAGSSYKITVNVYGFQQIEITAALEKWNEVDAGEVTPEDM